MLRTAGSLLGIVVANSDIKFFLNPRAVPDASHFKIQTHQMSTTSLISNQPMQTSAGNGSTPLIQLSDVRKVFLTDEVETHAVSGVHLDIHDGEYVSIAGPSGCGKTTLLSILGLLDTPSAGSYALKGTEVANLSFADRARIRNREIGFIFQSFNLIGDLTVYENVELPLTYRGLSAIQRKTAVIEALERVGTAHRAKHLPAQLSGGQQQRVAVARALAGKPAILLADEPTGNLDSRNGEAVMDLLKELHVGGATICMVTHDERFAGHAERAVHLLDGQVVEDRLAA
jgi:putative ABC transport system ATP-binding protein